MDIIIEANPNCPETEHIVFNEMEAPRRVRAIVVGLPGGDEECDVTGVDGQNRFVPAHALKINDSGEGAAFLIYGGVWGIRLRPASHASEVWDLKNPHQWGEAYKIYGCEEDIRFA